MRDRRPIRTPVRYPQSGARKTPSNTSPINFLALFRSEPRTLAFGLLHTFASSVGQTFFISLFLPEIRRTFGLGDAAIAGLFAVATVSSAAVLWRIGPVIDRMDVIRYSVASGLFLAGACLLMAGTCSELAGFTERWRRHASRSARR